MSGKIELLESERKHYKPLAKRIEEKLERDFRDVPFDRRDRLLTGIMREIIGFFRGEGHNGKRV